MTNAQNTPPGPYGSNVPVNYVRSWDVIKPVTNPNDLTITSQATVTRVATQYSDGLGRPLQTVIKQGSLSSGSAGAVDMVSPRVYDEMGRDTYHYLPYAGGGNDGVFKQDPFNQQAGFYNSSNSAGPLAGQGEVYFYGKTDYESSPLGRVLKTMAPGNSWVGSNKGAEIKYWINTATDAVHIWTVTDVAGAFPTFTTTNTAIYAAGELFKRVSVDDKGKQVIEFSDKEGQLLLKKVEVTSNDNGTGSGHNGWLCTYYVYDLRNRLTAIIMPKGVELLPGNSWNINAEGGTILQNQCFRYQYDSRNRIIRKKSTGLVETRLVYDACDRLVMTQDRKLNSAHQWIYTKYDVLNRPVASGMFKDDAHYNDLDYHVAQAANNSDYPVLGNFTQVEELSKTFYDNYGWRSSEGNPLNDTYQTLHNSSLQSASTSTFPYAESPAQSLNTLGRVTGSKVKIIGTSTYLYSVPIYDDKGRVIQVLSGNITGGTDITTMQYSFSSQLLTVVEQTQKNGTNPQTHIVKTVLEYDILGRLSTVKKQINSTVGGQTIVKPEQVIVTNQYDALGQLKKKVLGNGTLEDIDYSYNIQGWLTGINKDYVAGGAGIISGWNWGMIKQQLVEMGPPRPICSLMAVFPEMSGKAKAMG